MMRRLTFIRVCLRSFFIQSVWNFEKMQNIGFAHTISPALKELSRKDYRDLLLSHAGFFNTNPYMASPVVGAVIRMEEEGAKEKDIATFKRALMGMCGAIGDTFFWGALKPFASVLALLFAIKGWSWAPLILLIVFNLPHLYMRTVGLWRGYTSGKKVARYIKGLNISTWAQRIRYLTIPLLGVFLYLMVDSMEHGGGYSVYLNPLLMVVLSVWLLRRGITITKIVYLYTIVWLLIIFIGGEAPFTG